MVPKVYAAAMLVTTALLFWLLSAEHKTTAVPTVGSTVAREQLRPLKDPAVWRYCQYYSIVFGGYVALALWMTKYYVQRVRFQPAKSRRCWRRASPLPGGLLRAFGGWMSDRYGAHPRDLVGRCWCQLDVPVPASSYPQTQLHGAHHQRPGLTFHIGLESRAVHRPVVRHRRRPSRSARPRCSSTSPTSTRKTSAPCPASSD